MGGGEREGEEKTEEGKRGKERRSEGQIIVINRKPGMKVAS